MVLASDDYTKLTGEVVDNLPIIDSFARLGDTSINSDEGPTGEGVLTKNVELAHSPPPEVAALQSGPFRLQEGVGRATELSSLHLEEEIRVDDLPL